MFSLSSPPFGCRVCSGKTSTSGMRAALGDTDKGPPNMSCLHPRSAVLYEHRIAVAQKKGEISKFRDISTPNVHEDYLCSICGRVFQACIGLISQSDTLYCDYNTVMSFWPCSRMKDDNQPVPHFCKAQRWILITLLWDQYCHIWFWFITVLSLYIVIVYCLPGFVYFL